MSVSLVLSIIVDGYLFVTFVEGTAPGFVSTFDRIVERHSALHFAFFDYMRTNRPIREIYGPRSLPRYGPHFEILSRIGLTFSTRFNIILVDSIKTIFYKRIDICRNYTSPSDGHAYVPYLWYNRSIKYIVDRDRFYDSSWKKRIRLYHLNNTFHPFEGSSRE